MLRMATRRLTRSLAFPVIAMALVLAALALVAGCVALKDLEDVLPVATGSEAQPERQIVVTFRDSNGGLRAAPGSTARAYSSPSTYQASAYARRVIAALEHDYSIDWVAGWRIDLLNVHCVVFRARDQLRVMRCWPGFNTTRASNLRSR